MENSIQSWHRHELSCYHLMTLFASSSTRTGIVSPICLAARDHVILYHGSGLCRCALAARPQAGTI